MDTVTEAKLLLTVSVITYLFKYLNQTEIN